MKLGFDDDVHVQNTMVPMYCCCNGEINYAWKVFDESLKLDSVSRSQMIGGYVRLGWSLDAIRKRKRLNRLNGILQSHVHLTGKYELGTV